MYVYPIIKEKELLSGVAADGWYGIICDPGLMRWFSACSIGVLPVSVPW